MKRGNVLELGIVLEHVCSISVLFSTQYVSDVGGSAGLILGISAATLLGVFESSIIFMVNIIYYITMMVLY